MNILPRLEQLGLQRIQIFLFQIDLRFHLCFANANFMKAKIIIRE